jgi:ubiquinone/menaquinone biosynthesis C-methylase UbiE
LALHNGSSARLPFADRTLNGVVTVNTIYFVAELQEAFTELARVTAHSGRIVVGVADPEMIAKLPFTGHSFRIRPIPEASRRCKAPVSRCNTVGSMPQTGHPTC